MYRNKLVICTILLYYTKVMELLRWSKVKLTWSKINGLKGL